MTESRTQDAASYKPIRAPHGPSLSCKGWQQEAALRMLMNSVDPGVAEHPEELMVSGGIGKVARDWETFHAIVKSLQALEGDETLLIHSGELAPILKTQPDVPRVLLVSSILPPPAQNPPSAESEPAMPARATRLASDWMFTGPSSALPQAHETFRAAARKHFSGSLAGRLVVAGGMGGMGGAQALAATLNGAAFLGIDADADRIKRRVKTGYCEVMVNNLDETLRILKNAVRKREAASVGLIGNAAELIPELADRGVLPDLLTDQTPADDPFAYIPRGLTMAQATELRGRDPRAYRERALDSIATQVRGMLQLKKMGAVVFEFGNGMRAQAFARGVTGAYEIPDFASEYLLPDFARGRGMLTLIALSGDSDDLARVDALFAELFPESELPKWVAIARKRPSPGLPARSCWIGRDEAMKLGTAINDLVARGEIKAPVAIGRSSRQNRGRSPLDSQLPAQAANSGSLAQALADSPALAAILHAASGASWLSLQATAGPDQSWEQSSSLVAVADGRPKTAEGIERLFADDFAAAVSLFAPPRQNRS
jgi:urocanate hydratase